MQSFCLSKQYRIELPKLNKTEKNVENSSERKPLKKLSEGESVLKRQLLPVKYP